MASASNSFLDRVLARVTATVRDYTFQHWAPQSGKPTDEAVGLLPVPGVDAEKFFARVMDVGHYLGNIDHVVESRVVTDPAYAPPKSVRFYQRIKIPLLGDIQQEVAMERLEARQGFEIASFRMLEPETAALSPKVAARNAYADGAWLVAPGLVGYALSSAPRREDVGFLKWKALTTGADVAAGKVIRGNIEGMARWAAKS